MARADGKLRLFLSGDVMTGRGIDQVLPHPVDPRLYESHVRDARDYLALAEKKNGPISRPVSFTYIWGDALAELDRANVDLRLINLETSVTAGGRPSPGKGIHYRMHPQNIPCLKAAKISACALANNHVLDWGRDGLADTLKALAAAGIPCAGAGKNVSEATAPVALRVADTSRVLFFSFAATTSGVPPDWRATDRQAGVHLLDDLSETTATRIAEQMHRFHEPGDLLVASIHWGGNWGYEVPPEQVRFAHRLVEEGVDVVHGHSSHHVKAVEVFRNRLILYGCGDLLTDYEGISGYEMFRGDMSLLYLPELDAGSGELVSMRMVPMEMRRFRLTRPSEADVKYLHTTMSRLGERFGSRAELEGTHALVLRW